MPYTCRAVPDLCPLTAISCRTSLRPARRSWGKERKPVAEAVGRTRIAQYGQAPETSELYEPVGLGRKALAVESNIPQA
jgi:hypothetical protein